MTPTFEVNMKTRALLALLLALILSAPCQAQVVCVGAGCGGGGTVTSPISTDPLSITGVLTCDNAANTTATFADGLCSAGALDATGSICLTTNTITGEGTTANAFETLLAFGDATADATATLTGTAGGATLKLGAGVASAPALLFGTDTATGFGQFTTNAATVWTNGGAEMVWGVGATDYYGRTGNVLFRFESGTLRAASGQAIAWSNSATSAPGTLDSGLSRSAVGVVKVTNGSTGGGNVHIGAGDLTAASMTLEASTQARTVTSSYTWTNAQVAALGAVLEGDITVVTLPAKTQVLDAAIVVTGAAAGPATVTASLGDAIGGTPFITYIVASDIKAAANTYYGDAVAERGTSLDVEHYYLPSYTATTLVTVHFISTGANLSTVTGSTGRVILTTRIVP